MISSSICIAVFGSDEGEEESPDEGRGEESSIRRTGLRRVRMLPALKVASGLGEVSFTGADSFWCSGTPGASVLGEE